MSITKAIGDCLFTYFPEKEHVLITETKTGENELYISFYDLEQFVREVQEEKMRKG